MLSPLGKVANECDPIAVCFNSPSFRGFPLGGRLLAKQGGEGCRYPHPRKQSGEQLQHLLSPLGRVASNREPIAVCFNSPSFRGFPSGGGSLRSKAMRGVVIHIPASRAEQSAGNGLFQFSVFSRLPLGGRLLAKQGGEGRRYPHPGKQNGEQLQHLLSPLGRVASECEPIAVFKAYLPLSAKNTLFQTV